MSLIAIANDGRELHVGATDDLQVSGNLARESNILKFGGNEGNATMIDKEWHERYGDLLFSIFSKISGALGSLSSSNYSAKHEFVDLSQ